MELVLETFSWAGRNAQNIYLEFYIKYIQRLAWS